MLEQETAQSIWEWSLIAVVRRELEQLQYLDSDISDDTGDSDAAMPWSTDLCESW